MILTLSMSAIQTYKRCPKKFDIRYRMGLEDAAEKREALVDGTAFHYYMEQYAKRKVGLPYDSELNWVTPMGEVAIDYIKHRGFPAGEILSIDDAHYVQVLPDVRLRTTFDLVYAADNVLTIRDYKTFAQMPTRDIDLDFQGRVYLWAATQLWPGYIVYRFEHELVRRTCPYVPKDKKGGSWTPAECYPSPPSMILSPQELEQDGKELLQTIRDIVQYDVNTSRIWPRVNLRGGGFDACSSCSVKELCKQDKQGNLDAATIESSAVRAETIYSQA